MISEVSSRNNIFSLITQRFFTSICPQTIHLTTSQLVHESKIIIAVSLWLNYEIRTSYQKPPTAKHSRLLNLLFLSNFTLTVSIHHIHFIYLLFKEVDTKPVFKNLNTLNISKIWRLQVHFSTKSKFYGIKYVWI